MVSAVGVALAVLEVGGLLALLSLFLQTSLSRAYGLPPGLAAWSAVTLAASWAFAFYVGDLYRVPKFRTWGEFAPRFVVSVPVALLLALAGLALLSPQPAGARLLPVTALGAVALVLPLRAATISVLRRPAFAERVLLVGQGPLAMRIRALTARTDGYVVVAQLSEPPHDAEAECGEKSPLGNALNQLIGLVQPHLVVMALQERRGCFRMLELVSLRIAGTRVEEGTEFYERLAKKLAIENLTPSHLVFCSAFTKKRSHLLVHRTMSVLVAVVGLVTMAPLMAVVAMLVKLDSAGPVFFVQRRVGYQGRVFSLVKFRTMRGGPSPDDGVWNRHDELRVTRLGRVLRKTRIDELPQLWNVLVGDMNLVGPRPEMAQNIATMSEQIPYYVLRHTIPPGVTGWAQVRQGYAVTYDEVLEKTCYDLYYIKNMSLVFDVRIMLETARVMLSLWGAR